MELQKKRTYDCQFDDFYQSKISDHEFFIITAARFIQCAESIFKLVKNSRNSKIQTAAIESSLKNFNEKHREKIIAARNVIEHIDEYISRKGFNNKISRNTILTTKIDENSTSTAGMNFNFQEIIEDAMFLINAVKNNPPSSYKEKVKIVKESGNTN